MELTLLLAQDDAARLGRLALVRAARTGRTRVQVTRIVWHDGPDRALTARGLALTEERGVWRLEQNRPKPTEPWQPATDHRLLADAKAPDGLPDELPDGPIDVRADALTPIAAFEGKQTIVSMTVDSETVTMVLLRGVLRAGTAEQPDARLVLRGPDGPVRTLALLLAETVALAVPPWSMAAEASRLADGTAPIPRRTGAPTLPSDCSGTHTAFTHILGHLTDVILFLAREAVDPAGGPEPVHQLRVAVRRARSALSLFQPAFSQPGTDGLERISGGLKQLGQALGPARDWDVFMTETAAPVAEVLAGEAALANLLRTGARRREAARAALAAYLTGPEFRRLGLELACLAGAGWPAGADTPPREFAATVLRARYKKVSRTAKHLEGLDDPGLHALRLKAKRLRYAAEFFAPLFPDKPTSRFIRRLSVLQERLGVFNDTTVAAGLLRELSARPGFAAGLVLGFTAARGAGIRPKIAAAWVRFRRRSQFWE